MKTTILFSVLVLLFTIGKAQSGNDLLGRIPAIPGNVCGASKETQQQFKENVSALIRELDAQMLALRKQSKPDEAKAKSQAEQMLRSQGLSQEDMEKMKSKKMTKEDRQAMAARMMQQYGNMSMGEVNNMKNMSKEGKQAYMEAYATEAQATAQSNAKNGTPQTVNSNSSAEVITQRTELYQNLKTQQQEILTNYQKVDEDVDGLKLVEKMNALRARMAQLVGGGGEGGWIEKEKKEYDAKREELNQLKKDYCQLMSPKYFGALKTHLANLQSSYNDYRQLDDMSGKIDNSIINMGTTGKGGQIEYLDWANSYLEYLREAYKYRPVEE